MKQLFKVIQPCIDQDTKADLKPGQIVSFKSDFERGRHLAEKNVVPHIPEIERQVEKPIEIRIEKPKKRRVRPRKKKNVKL